MFNVDWMLNFQPDCSVPYLYKSIFLTPSQDKNLLQTKFYRFDLLSYQTVCINYNATVKNVMYVPVTHC